MTVFFSRHAKRRMKLYRLAEKDVVDAILRSEASGGRSGATRNLIDFKMDAKYGYPLKIVYVRERARVVVITAYPVKKGKRR
ncbi:MAG: DUF4258 domain-containing protein [Bacteroidota bacterium]